ncbi:MAG: hypothetical protein FWG70_00115 [Oscillospiraceae bacterium]|nr:hypothetical protein [Oscillospiraceae bacterium]
MKIMKRLAAVVVFALVVCLAITPAVAAEINWIEVYDRFDARSGISFNHAKLLEGVGNTPESEYRFTYVVENSPNDDPDFEGIDYKVVTQGGEISPADLPYLRFTGPFQPNDIEILLGEITLVAHIVPGEQDANRANIRPDYMRRSGMLEHEITINSQSRTAPSFYIKNIIVEHILDGETTVIYEMATDPLVQGLSDGDEFIEGSSGLSRADVEGSRFEASYRIVRGPAPEGANISDVTPPPPPPPPTEPEVTAEPETPPPAETEIEEPAEQVTPPAPASSTSDNGGVSSMLIVLIGVSVVAIVIAALGAVVLKKK